MFRRFSANFAVLSIFFDMFLAITALFISTSTRQSFNFLPFVQDIPESVNLPLSLYFSMPLVWVLVLTLFSLYDGRRNLRVVDEFSSLTLGTLLASVCMAGLLYFSYRSISRFLFLFFILSGYTFLILWRSMYRLAYRMKVVSSSSRRRVLILGAGKIGRRLETEIINNPHLGLTLVGFLDDDPIKIAQSPGVIGPLDLVQEIVLEKKVEDVVIALPMNAHQRLNQVVSILHDAPVQVWVIPDYFSITLLRASVEDVAGLPMLALRAPALSEYQRMVKRAFDLVVSILLIPVAIPLMVVTALLIRLDSQGPVLIRQKRVGEGGRLFEMIKFRTMVKNAEQLRHLVEQHDENGNLIHKSPKDPRITRFGSLLRRLSVDELPQLFNVFRGEMSLVGPRPELPYLVEKYEPWQRKRFTIPQGMTGWWQITGRSDKPMHLHTEEDLYYIQHYSIWLDMQIILKTFWVALRGRGAY